MEIFKNWIIDGEGRTLILRGVNLGGGSKNPFGPPGWGLTAESLKIREDASFVGRPFPLEEAESHFERLSRAGLTFLRLVITWEALEHAGPGQYDEAYLAYLRKILLEAEKKGISVFIDPHQDVWSRWTGGDGAPAWTLEKTGIDLDLLDVSGSAMTRQRYGEFHKSAAHPEGDPFPGMMWPVNYNRYAAATMFSLFFGGRVFAPGLDIEGENVQDWLQERYIAAFRHCYRRLKNCAALTGWGIMNEPHYGFIGHRDLRSAENPMVPLGQRPSPWACMQAASGYPVEVPVHRLGRPVQWETLNPGGVSIFKEGFACPWKQAGVWTDSDGEARLLRPDHFSAGEDRPVDFLGGFLKPFIRRFIERMKEADENCFFFIEGLPQGMHPAWEKEDPPNAVNAYHWYDGFSLFTKSFRPWFNICPENAKIILGRKKVRSYFAKCLAEGVAWTREHMGNIPCLLGEFGLPFDMNKRSAFTSGNYDIHEEALSMYYDAVDANLLHSTLWNYTADNTNKAGDGWNDEDLSIFSEGRERAGGGWKRPYPPATAGEPLSINWDRQRGVFRYRYRADGAIAAPTIIFLPAEQFGEAPQIELIPLSATPAAGTGSPPDSPGRVAGPRFEYRAGEERLYVWNEGRSGELEIVCRRAKALS